MQVPANQHSAVCSDQHTHTHTQTVEAIPQDRLSYNHLFYNLLQPPRKPSTSRPQGVSWVKYVRTSVATARTESVNYDRSRRAQHARAPGGSVPCRMVDIPPDEVSSTANEKDFALPEGDLRGDVGGVAFEAMNIFRGLDSAPSRATAS